MTIKEFNSLKTGDFVCVPNPKAKTFSSQGKSNVYFGCGNVKLVPNEHYNPFDKNEISY